MSIPLGYEYSNKVYRSFTSSDSPSLTFITSNLTTSSINDIIKEDTIVYDTLLNRLSFKQLNSLSSSLLVCSTNNKFNIKTTNGTIKNYIKNNKEYKNIKFEYATIDEYNIWSTKGE